MDGKTLAATRTLTTLLAIAALCLASCGGKTDCTMLDCFCGTGSVEGYAGSYGNVATGRFPGGHPRSSIFTVNWSGITTAYTPSPFDP